MLKFPLCPSENSLFAGLGKAIIARRKDHFSGELPPVSDSAKRTKPPRVSESFNLVLCNRYCSTMSPIGFIVPACLHLPVLSKWTTTSASDSSRWPLRARLRRKSPCARGSSCWQAKDVQSCHRSGIKDFAAYGSALALAFHQKRNSWIVTGRAPFRTQEGHQCPTDIGRGGVHFANDPAGRPPLDHTHPAQSTGIETHDGAADLAPAQPAISSDGDVQTVARSSICGQAAECGGTLFEPARQGTGASGG
jgi:hypothetical protein